ncbi:uncharacterized protein DDB_G0290301-like [Haliotis asinina]|uniref:uncharacterized protein DDB_G0290301-like n=1 Tax=Haliotis asinina TaxID=109174 RepID=UPI00353192EC
MIKYLNSKGSNIDRERKEITMKSLSREDSEKDGQRKTITMQYLSGKQRHQLGPAVEEDNSDFALTAWPTSFLGHTAEKIINTRNLSSAVFISHLPIQLKPISMDRRAMDVRVILIVAVRLLSTQGSTVHVLRFGLSTGCVLLIGGIVCIFVLCFRHRRQTAQRDNQRGETIRTYRSGQLETGEYFPVQQYWDIDDYDEVSQSQEQQQRKEEYYDEVSQSQEQQQREEEYYDEVSQSQEQQQRKEEYYDEVSQSQEQQQREEEYYDEVSQSQEQQQRKEEYYDEVSQSQEQQQREEEYYDEVSPQQRPAEGKDYYEVSQQQQGPVEEEDYDEVSQQQRQQEPTLNSNPAFPALAGYFPGPRGSEDDDSDSVLPVLADYYPGAQDTEDNNGSDTSHSSASASQSYAHLIRDVFVDNPRTVVTYLSPTEDLE